MPKSAASAHLTATALPLVAAMLSFTGFLMTLNLYLPPSKHSSKDSPQPPAKTFAPPRPFRKRPWLPRPANSGHFNAPQIPYPTRQPIPCCAISATFRANWPSPQAPRKPHSTPTRSPSALKRPTPPFIRPRKNPIPSTTHNLVPLQLRRQPHPEATFSLEPNSAFCYHQA